MKINDIKALAELVSKNNLSALEYSEGETHLRIENAPRTVTVAPAQAAPARNCRRESGFFAMVVPFLLRSTGAPIRRRPV